MTAATSQEVAEEAIFQLQVAVSALSKARHLFAVIKPLTEQHSSAHELIELGEMFVMEHEFEGNAVAKKLDGQLDAFKANSAPQNAEMPNRGAASNSSRMPLADFAAGRHADTAKLLGMTQGSLSKAIREGRSIFVTGSASEGYQAFEERSFPAQRRTAEAGQ